MTTLAGEDADAGTGVADDEAGGAGVVGKDADADVDADGYADAEADAERLGS